MRSASFNGRRLLQLRESKGWSQDALADEVSKHLGRPLSKYTISKYECEARSPRPDIYLALCDALGVDRDVLVGGSDAAA